MNADQSQNNDNEEEIQQQRISISKLSEALIKQEKDLVDYQYSNIRLAHELQLSQLELEKIKQQNIQLIQQADDFETALKEVSQLKKEYKRAIKTAKKALTYQNNEDNQEVERE